MNTRAPRRRLDGVLMIDKPAGLTSNQVLGVIKRLFNAEKAGHTGTLDPFATGLLPVALGEATKFSGHLLHADKTYLATLALGTTTTTGDIEGEVLQTRDVNFNDAQLATTLPGFLGTQMQTPPMYSALKRDGKPLYEYAREGITLEREAREVRIDALELISRGDAELTIRVRCSKGTYIRTLAEDIGEALGCGAHLRALRREETGGFTLEDAHGLDFLGALSNEERDTKLLSADTLVRSLPALAIDAALAARVAVGQRIALHEISGTKFVEDTRYRVFAQSGAFLGVMQARQGALRPERLVSLQV